MILNSRVEAFARQREITGEPLNSRSRILAPNKREITGVDCTTGKFYHRCVSVEVKCENQMKRTFFISFSTFCRSEDMPRVSSSIIAQSLKTLQRNGPRLVYTEKKSNNKYY